MEQKHYDVFISYSRKDYVDKQKNIIPGNEVAKIKEALAETGISYWFDEDGIYSGQNFVDKLVTNIENSKVFLFLSTENSNKSEWTCKEIACAAEFKKHIIPVRIDSSPYNKRVLFRIADLDYIEYYTNPHKGMGDMLDSIKAYIEEWDAEEKRRLYEENMRKEHDDTILRKHREEKLRECHENIIKLEQQREELIKEKLSYEKELVGVNSKLKLLEQELVSLKENERVLLEANNTTNERLDDKIVHEGFFLKEIKDLVKAFSARHWLLNCIEVLCFIYFISTGFLFLYLTIESSNSILWACATACSYLGFVGIYRMMKNNKDCLYWLLISCLSAIFLLISYPNWTIVRFTSIAIIVLLILIILMFIRKNKLSAWKVLQNKPIKLVDDPIYSIMIFFLVIGILGVMALLFI